jgi:hypothetical protein
MLDLCWHHYRIHGAFLKIRDAYFTLEKPEADAAVARLTGSLVRRGWSSSSLGEHYEITYLGALVSSDGTRLQHLIERYLLAIKALYDDNHQIRGIESDKFKAYLDKTGDELSSEELQDLGRVLVLGIRLVDTNVFGPQPNGTWSVSIGDNIDDIRRIPHIGSFVQQELIKGFDPEEPITENERMTRLIHKNTPPFWPGAPSASATPEEQPEEVLDLSFMRDQKLREICEADWRDACSAKRYNLPKPAIILCGAVAEGLLLDALEQIDPEILADACKARKVIRSVEEMGLDDLVRVASQLSKIRSPNNHLAQFLREYRNFVHPARQRKEAVVVSADDVTAALVAVRLLARDISGGSRA